MSANSTSSSSQLSVIFRQAIQPEIQDLRVSVDAQVRPALAMLVDGTTDAVKTYNPVNKTYLQKVKTGSATAYFGDENSAYIPSMATYEEATIPVKQQYISINVTDFLRAIAKDNNESAIIDYAKSIKDDILDAKARALDYYLHGDQSGTVTTVTTGAGPGTTLTLVVADNSNIEIGDELNIDTAGNLDAGSDSTLTVYTVTAKSGTTGLTVSASTSDTVANSDLIVRRYSRTSSGKAVIEGFGNLISDTGTIFGVNRATTGSNFQSYLNTTGEALSLTGNMLSAARFIMKYGGKNTAILASPFAWSKFYSLLSSQLRQMGNFSANLIGGVKLKGLEYTFAENAMVILDETQADTVAGTSGVMNFIGQNSLVYAKVAEEFDYGSTGNGVQMYNTDGRPTPGKQVLYNCFQAVAWSNPRHLARLTAKT